jgi:hypothetical protein
LYRGLGTNGAIHFWSAGTILRQQKAGTAIIRARAIDVSLNHFDKGRLACSDRLMQFGDRRFFEPE